MISCSKPEAVTTTVSSDFSCAAVSPWVSRPAAASAMPSTGRSDRRVVNRGRKDEDAQAMARPAAAAA
ncbi:hypothetical protein [Comamonas sp. wu1-DMT]|uniref:hypothetical protein n=1 Tax=Comamonas sp. wu1-DMT TaxID=3126390 RepID=UPI0032E3F3B2